MAILDSYYRLIARQSGMVSAKTFAVAFLMLWVGHARVVKASHVLNDGLPEKPVPDQSVKLKAFDWHLYSQIRYTYTEDEEERLALRRLKLNMGGNITDHVQYFIQGLYKNGNGSPTDNHPSVQDAWGAYEFLPSLRFMVGQFKPPFGMERFTSDARIYTIDRSQATDHLVPNGKLDDSFTRDRGFQLDGWNKQGRLYYAVGVFEGEGANTKIRNVQPLLTARLVYQLFDQRPVLRQPMDIYAGSAFSNRWANDLDLSGCCPGPQSRALQSFSGQDTRLNAGCAVDWGNSSLRAEYFYARFDFRNSTTPDFSADGWYVQIARYVFDKHIQAVAKFEGFDPNRSVEDKNGVFITTLGLNFFMNRDRAKVMVDYLFRQEETDSFSNNALLIQFQLFFK